MTQTWNADAYGKNGAFVHELAGDVLAWLAPHPGETILDLGCGDGQLSARIAASGATVIGLDASPQMAAAALSRGIVVHEGNAESMPFAEDAFDAVFSNAALHWVRNHQAMLSEVRRVLKPGGRFVAETGGHGNIPAMRVAFAVALARNGFEGREEDVNYFPSPNVYRRMLQSHGFHVERIELIPRPTQLPQSGMAGWFTTFRRGVLDTLPEDARARVVEEAVALLRPVLCDEDGNWTADYLRLRFIAQA